ncbi:hypothetical protein M514_22787 [Trichuris suis]|uniref:RING-type domain-containing protein n=1 Tax=Trichuris suis TaxID=68888 RepID=A0A085N6H4_9BILA|nr:hypothetical protein M514_22787 [Trichuris suis]
MVSVVDIIESNMMSNSQGSNIAAPPGCPRQGAPGERQTSVEFQCCDLMPYSPTVVETVSINFDDFNESFLTCSTCLYPFDANNRKPKLLSCSHTVCCTCLGAIADLPRPSESGSIRCPICREVVAIPRGGILALPPSFMVNQLIDLLNGRKRDLIPKCPLHSNEVSLVKHLFFQPVFFLKG